MWSKEDRYSNSYRLVLKIKEHRHLREELMDILTLHGIINSHVQAWVVSNIDSHLIVRFYTCKRKLPQTGSRKSAVSMQMFGGK